MKRIKRLASAALAAGLLVAVVAAGDLLPAGSDWTVCSGGQNIGDLDVSSTGNLLVFNDNPNTDHPPNTSGSWALNSEGTGYGNGGGHTTTFTRNEDGTYSWKKTEDSSGDCLDSGTIKPRVEAGPRIRRVQM